MATPPDFVVGQVLTAAHMDAVGLWLLKTETVGSAVASVTVTDAFSSDYDNYKIIVSGVDSSAASAVCRFTLGAATTGYYGSYLSDLFNGTVAVNRVNNGSYCETGTFNNTDNTYITIEVSQPGLAKPTNISGTWASGGAGGWIQGYHITATAYTEFTLTPASGTITGGTIRVYGYRN